VQSPPTAGRQGTVEPIPGDDLRHAYHPRSWRSLSMMAFAIGAAT
jgi:hypothetical protein